MAKECESQREYKILDHLRKEGGNHCDKYIVQLKDFVVDSTPAQAVPLGGKAKWWMVRLPSVFNTYVLGQRQKTRCLGSPPDSGVYPQLRCCLG